MKTLNKNIRINPWKLYRNYALDCLELLRLELHPPTIKAIIYDNIMAIEKNETDNR